MTSQEIATLSGKDHSNVMRDIRKLIDEVGTEFKNELGSYSDSNGQSRPLYVLEKKSVYLLVTGYSAIIRMKVIDRVEELENKLNAPKSRLELARENVLLIEEIERKDQLLLESKPKADFYDAVTGSKDAISISEASKVLNLSYGSITLFKKLRELKVLMNGNIPYQEYIDRAWFRVIESKYNKPDGSTHISLKTVVYQKGLDGIRKLLSK